MSNADEAKRYDVLDPAAVFVAGQRVAEDRTVVLADAQARYPLLQEQIRPADARRAKPKSVDSAS